MSCTGYFKKRGTRSEAQKHRPAGRNTTRFSATNTFTALIPICGFYQSRPNEIGSCDLQSESSAIPLSGSLQINIEHHQFVSLSTCPIYMHASLPSWGFNHQARTWSEISASNFNKFGPMSHLDLFQITILGF